MRMELPTITLPRSAEPIGAHSDLLGMLLAEQQDFSAVERFASLYDQNSHCTQARHYESLMPLTPLAAGEQYAFQVDLDRCSGCKACVTACHALNGLDETETWRDVGLLYSENSSQPYMQHITSACHHCVDPACMNACPTNAYEKDPITGIVKHLDDQCFGCQYCTLACPYGVPKYHEKKGIVRKCDLCSQRLSAGEAPACVQACPHEAISIAKVDVEEVKQKAAAGDFITGAHDPSYTQPTTVYKSTNPLPENLVRGDHYVLAPEHAHYPLVIMLVLTQVAAGMFLGLSLLNLYGSDMIASRWVSLVAFGLLQLALGASTLHLGRPLLAPRGILGFFHSWLSREIVAFGLFAGMAGHVLLAVWVPSGWNPFPAVMQSFFSWSAAATGFLGIFCSCKIYQYTQRAYWNSTYTFSKFFGTAFLAGFTTLAATLNIISLLQTGTGSSWLPQLTAGILLAAITKVGFESLVFQRLKDTELTTLKKSALLTIGPLKPVFCIRIAGLLIGLGGLLLMNLIDGMIPGILLSVLTAATVIVGELAERHLYFSAVVAPKMPRGF